MTYLDIAIEHVKRGIPVVPINNITNKPSQFSQPTADINKVKSLWRFNINRKIGIKLGDENGIFIVHISTVKELNGYRSLKYFEEQYCLLPETLSIANPFQEIRIYTIPKKYRPFKVTTNSCMLGLTFKGDSGFIVSPFEINQDAFECNFINNDIGIVDIPQKLINLLIGHKLPFFIVTEPEPEKDIVDNNEDEILTPLTSNEISSFKPNSKKWYKPKELDNISKSADYPIDDLPPSIKNAVDEVVSFIQCPVALAASSALGVLSLAIQPYFNIARSKSLVSPVSLFFLSIAPSGARKSSSDSRFMKSLRTYESKKQSELMKKTLTYQSNIKIWEEKEKALKNKLRNETTRGQNTTNTENQIKEHIKNKPVKPSIPKFFYNDFSLEALVHGLANTWPSAGVMSSEGGTVFGSYGMSKDAAVKTISSFNVLWDGAPLSFDKMSSGSLTVKDVRLTISLQVQKEIIEDFLKKSPGVARGSGFLARFLISEQEIKEARIYKDEPDVWKALDKFNNRIDEILKKDPQIEYGRLKVKTMYFSDDAANTWKNFYNNIEKEIVENGLFSDIKDFASKAAENIARLACLFHIFEHGESDICEDCVIKANNIIKWHLFEAKRIFGTPIQIDNKIKKFDEWIIRYCKQHNLTSVKSRTAQQYGHVSANELKNILNVLQELNRLRFSDDGKMIEVNPNLLST